MRLRQGGYIGVGPRRIIQRPTSAGFPTVWSPTDHDGFITVSNGNAIATRNNTGGGAWKSARTDTAQTSGIRYVEFTILQVGTNGCYVGVASGAASVANYVGADNNGCSYEYIGNTIKNAAFTGVTPPSFTTGDVIGMVVDIAGATVKFNKNGGAFSATIDITSLGASVFATCSLGDGATFSSVRID